MLRGLDRSMAFGLATAMVTLFGAPASQALTLPKPPLQQSAAANGPSLLHKVHGWHCRRRYGPVRICRNGYCRTVYRWHRHRRACYGGRHYGPSINLYIGPRYRSRRYRRRGIHRPRIHRRRLHRPRIRRHFRPRLPRGVRPRLRHRIR